MKRYNYDNAGPFWATLALFLLASCSNQLDIKPTAELESEYFDSELRIQEGVGACYAGFYNLYGPLLNDGGGAHQILMLPGDDITHQDAGRGALEAFSGLNSSNGEVNMLWTRLYQIIYRCNFMLEKMEEEPVQAVYLTAGLSDVNRGEVLFLRAWCFYRLWDFFRKAPLQSTRIHSISEAVLPPTRDFELLDKAIEDLKLAATLLPAESFWKLETERGRVFDESAYAMLVKCHVLRARYNKADAADYQNAISAFKEIRTRKLVHFADNFDYRYENNAESLFELQASHATDQDNAWLDNNFGGGAGQMGAMYHYNTNHWSNYISGIYGPTKKLVSAFDEGDPRKTYTIAKFTTNVFGDTNIPGPAWDKFDGYQLMKYVYPGRCWFEKIWGISSTNNTRLIRYADIKLLAAEAYLQTGNTAEALVQVNDVRARARRSTEDGKASAVPADYATLTIRTIMNERFIELAGEEGTRWTDLRSWHAAGFINLASWTARDFGYNYDTGNFEFQLPRHLLFPIPQREMNTNPLMASAGNNPGYD